MSQFTYNLNSLNISTKVEFYQKMIIQFEKKSNCKQTNQHCIIFNQITIQKFI